MKRIVLIIVLIYSVVRLQAQGVTFPLNESGEIEFSEVVSTELTKVQLYSNAQEWIAKTFGDYKRVMQFEDEDNGKLILKGFSVVQVANARAERILYIITIECKDNKYRYKFDNITINGRFYSLGSTIDQVPFTPLNHLDQCRAYEKEANPSGKDTLAMNKFELRYYNNYGVKEKVAIEMDFYNSEYATIQRIIESLKATMSINNDF